MTNISGAKGPLAPTILVPVQKGAPSDAFEEKLQRAPSAAHRLAVPPPPEDIQRAQVVRVSNGVGIQEPAAARDGESQTGAAAALADASPTAKLHDALEAFQKEARKTPAERARDQILAKHHLSEDAYAALPPDIKREIDDEIVARTKLLMKSAGTAGSVGPADADTPTGEASAPPAN